MNGQRFSGRTALIVGGSQGIGRSAARQFVQAGGSVVVVARREGPLAETMEDLRKIAGDGVLVESAVGDAADETSIGPIIEGVVTRHGVPDYLLNFAGGAHPAYVTDLTTADLRAQMEANYFSQAVPALAMVPHFVAAGRGHFGFTSSMMGYFAIVGYAAYAPGKFAVVGFAEALRHECKPCGIGVSVLYPPDTDTPGLERENETKPFETAAISENVKLLGPDVVAERFLRGIAAGQLHIHPNGSGWVARANRYAPGIVRMILDHDLRAARKKKGSS